MLSRRCNAVVLRYDDIAAPYPTEPEDAYTQRVEMEEALFAIIAEADAQLTVGVQPYASAYAETGPDADYVPLDGDQNRLERLRTWAAAGVIEPALHGYTHQALTTLPGSSEFRGGAPALQRKRIQQGKQLLTDWLQVPTDIFIPPFFSYDHTTLGILVEEGFRVISSSRGYGPESEPELAYVHADVLQPESLVEFVQKAPLWHRRRIAVLVMHPFSFVRVSQQCPYTGTIKTRGPESSLEGLTQVLQRLQGENVELLSIGQAVECYPNAFKPKPWRYWLSQAIRALHP